MKKYIKNVNRFKWILVLMILFTGCDHADRKSLEQEKQVEEVALANQEETVEIIEDKEQEETNYDGYLSRYLVGTNTVYEVLEESTILKRFEMVKNGSIEDILADEDGTIYVLTFEYDGEEPVFVLYEINTKQEQRVLYQAHHKHEYLTWLKGNVTIIVEDFNTDEVWYVVYEKQTDSCTETKSNIKEVPESKYEEYKKCEKLFKDKYGEQYITEDENSIYYVKKKEEGTVESYSDVFQIDKETGSKKCIMDIPLKANAYRTYRIIDNDIYFRIFDGKSTKWMKHSLAGNGDTIDLHAIDYVEDYAKYGGLTDIYYNFYDDLDEKYMSVLLERFYFDKTLPHGEKMNKVLEDSYNTTIANFIEEIRIGELEDKNRDELYDIGKFSQTLWSAEVFNEHYILLEFDFEWFRDYYFLYYTFDLDTGEQLTLDNMYHGTEEHYKDVVAKYFVDTYKEEIKEGNEGFTEDMNYQYFYDRLSTNMYVIFGEDGLHVVFNAYDIVQYRDEEFAVIVPYEELGIEL